MPMFQSQWKHTTSETRDSFILILIFSIPSRWAPQVTIWSINTSHYRHHKRLAWLLCECRLPQISPTTSNLRHSVAKQPGKSATVNSVEPGEVLFKFNIINSHTVCFHLIKCGWSERTELWRSCSISISSTGGAVLLYIMRNLSLNLI